MMIYCRNCMFTSTPEYGNRPVLYFKLAFYANKCFRIYNERCSPTSFYGNSPKTSAFKGPLPFVDLNFGGRKANLWRNTIEGQTKKRKHSRCPRTGRRLGPFDGPDERRCPRRSTLGSSNQLWRRSSPL